MQRVFRKKSFYNSMQPFSSEIKVIRKYKLIVIEILLQSQLLCESIVMSMLEDRLSNDTVLNFKQEGIIY